MDYVIEKIAEGEIEERGRLLNQYQRLPMTLTYTHTVQRVELSCWSLSLTHVYVLSCKTGLGVIENPETPHKQWWASVYQKTTQSLVVESSPISIRPISIPETQTPAINRTRTVPSRAELSVRGSSFFFSLCSMKLFAPAEREMRSFFHSGREKKRNPTWCAQWVQRRHWRRRCWNLHQSHRQIFLKRAKSFLPFPLPPNHHPRALYSLAVPPFLFGLMLLLPRISNANGLFFSSFSSHHVLLCFFTPLPLLSALLTPR